jgi:hypothetical protein
MDLVGQRFGRWTVLSRVPGLSRSRHARFECRCDCGTTKTVLGYKMRDGVSLSCGCLRSELSSSRSLVHGMTGHRLFQTWNSMMARCHNPSNSAYFRYGGRGIVVCKRWHNVADFIADNDAQALPGLTIERIDNDGPYSPENTRWATRSDQSKNRRTNVLLTRGGVTKPLFDWARDFGIKPRTLWRRIKVSGWDVETALTTPVSVRGQP